MGADIKQLRNRIKSVDSTLHLTTAMGLVASSKIRKASDSMQKGREYADALMQTVENLSAFEECRKSAYMKARDGEKEKLVVIAGDRGLAGGYNANVFRLMREHQDAEIIPIGKRACERYGATLQQAEGFPFARALEIARELCEDFLSGKVDKVGIVYTRYESMMSQQTELLWLLPLTKNPNAPSLGAIFEPDEVTVLDAVIPQYLAGMITALVKESFASEVAARRVAMDNAGKNAREMISDLEIKYNRARQGAITQEITEIVAGSGS